MENVMSVLTDPAFTPVIVAAILLFQAVARYTPNKTDNMVLKYMRKAARVLGLDLPVKDRD